MVVELKGGFRPLWLRYDANCISHHQLFCKEHSVRNQDPNHPKGQTLFVLNVPPWASSESLKEAFSVCGPVKSVTLNSGSGNSKSGFGTAYVVFQRESSLDKAASLPADTMLTLHDDEEPSAIGLAKWCKEYNATVSHDESEAKKEIEEYMREYDERVAKRLSHEGEDEEAEEGEDGWVTVSSKKKRGQFAPARKESTIGKLQSKEERKSRKKELLNFYTFQIRESKKQNLVELRKKFELDKKKLQQLKTKRTFKPF